MLLGKRTITGFRLSRTRTSGGGPELRPNVGDSLAYKHKKNVKYVIFVSHSEDNETLVAITDRYPGCRLDASWSHD